MKLIKTAQAGSLESCDILITIKPGKPGSGFTLKLDSPSLIQFGEQIESEIQEVVDLHGIKDVKITAIDKGSLTYCIKARTETALRRASGEG
ncbi:MAG: citrate lyase acyl carrier protein [Candidatus Heimdallarchaeota archaeon]